ncbi:hypothetical protein CBR_g20273 [Chara braunii]|uniref:Core Histone H2A/H2B/H3 domain-containing protein n=1 Tax=Chara braunii TaxID=69332 RepID=A0A388L004_CHABU|nr:hypothetical protein CBR_g20273 [Chara braunii]|eukprot:GBG75644.1 hypothetical protein CBR_g20273 [Chara braunii]
METEDIVKGLADGSKEGNSVEMNTTDCADVLATIYAQTAEMMGDGDESENDAGGSTCETEKVGEERGEGGMGSRKNHAGCIVEDENVVKTLAGEQFSYDINWVPGRVQPGIVGGVPCFAFKVVGTWVPFPVPKTSAWRNVTLSIVFDRVLRLNDAARAQEKGKHALKMWRVLEAKGEFRLNDFLYDSFDCGTPWVIGGNDAAARTVCPENDARRDPRWGLVPYEIPITCGRVRMQMRDAMRNVWNTHYINGRFSFTHLNREVSEEEKKAMTCPPHTARCFFPPLRNPMELKVVDGKLFSGEDGVIYTAARGKEATYDGLWSQIWDHVTLRLVDGKVTMAAKLQSRQWLTLGWMYAGIVEHWQFLVVLARVSIFNVNVKDHVLLVEHTKRCWEKIREEDRKMVCAGYDSMKDQGMWSMVEGSCARQEHGDGENIYMAHIRRRHRCTTLLGWVPVVCPMTYEHGGDVTMTFTDPLGVPFHLTYSDGLLRDIRYVVENDLAGGLTWKGKRTEKRFGIFRLSAEVEGPCGPGGSAGCSVTQGDTTGPSHAAMSQSPRKMKKCVSKPPTGKTVAGKKKKSPKPVVEEDIAPAEGVRFHMTAVRALMEAVEAYLVVNFENTNEVAIHSKRVRIQVKDMRLVDRLSKPRRVEKYEGMLDERARAEERQRRMEARQAKRDGSRASAKKRKAVPRMCEDGDVDMTMHQKGGTYAPADFKKLLGTVAKNSDMLVDGSNDELKSGAIEILVLSRMKDITQTPPQDFQDVPVIVADGVKYVLLDQLYDFMKKSDEDRNVIHEALHEVTEFALQGKDLIEFVSARGEDDFISGRPLWRDLLSRVLDRLNLASCDVERQREREEWWKLIATETSLAIIPNNGETSAAGESISCMAVDVPPMQIADTEEILLADIFNANAMERGRCDVGFEDADLASCLAIYTDNEDIAEDEEEDEEASSSDVEKMDSGPRVCDCGRPFMSLRTLNSHRARACPTMVDERAQGQEMGVVDACGPSNIGAVNLVSDESEDIGAPENADGEGGPFAEQQPLPAESFDSSRKLAALIFSARGCQGLPGAASVCRRVT